MRIIIAGLVGAVLVFVWSFVSHMMLPLATTGMQQNAVEGEAAIIETLSSHLTEQNLYMMPGMDPSVGDMTAQMNDAEEKWRKGPTALIIYDPDGKAMGMPVQLGAEFATNLVGALLAALVLAVTMTSYPVRVAIVALMGVFAWVAIDASYLIWYGFPPEYVLAQGADHLIGWALAGLGIGAIVTGKRAAEPGA